MCSWDHAKHNEHGFVAFGDSLQIDDLAAATDIDIVIF